MSGGPHNGRLGRRLCPRAGACVGLALCLLFAGCKGGAAVVVDIRVPRPLVEPVDATMGVYFDDTLKSYVHEEDVDDHGAYRIDIGASQAPVFAQVFEAMFRSVAQVTVRFGDDGGPASIAADSVVGGMAPALDGILAPHIEEVQFAIPAQTGGEFYEVWIRYQIRLLAADGTPLAEWPLIGYGKANKANYGAIDQKAAALNEATIWALRDAAALLSFQFREQAEVQDWLAAVANGT